jgi:predicted transcriptional regulator
MFDQLFGSKTRVKLLSLFLNNPERPFYVREITRKIDEQINSVRRELSNMLSIGIIKSDKSDNKLYYQANKKYQYYPELQKIFSTIPIKSKVLKETKEEDQIAAKLRTTGSVHLAFLTGTFVREPYVSIDMLVVGDVNRARVGKVVGELEKELGREINYAIFTTEDFQYRLDLNDRFLLTVMDAKRISIIDPNQKSGDSMKMVNSIEVEEAIVLSGLGGSDDAIIELEDFPESEE